MVIDRAILIDLLNYVYICFCLFVFLQDPQSYIFFVCGFAPLFLLTQRKCTLLT